MEPMKGVNAGQIREISDIDCRPSSKARSQVRLAARRNNAWEDDNGIIHLESTYITHSAAFPPKSAVSELETSKLILSIGSF